MQLNGYKGNNMSLGGSSESSQQLDPALRDLFLQNYTGAQNVATGLQARQFEPFNADQNQAFALNRSLAGPLSAATRYGTRAADILNLESAYSPQNVTYQNALAQGYSPAQAQAASAGYSQGYSGASAGPAQYYGGTSAGPSQVAQAAQLNRNSIQNVNAAGVTGSQVAQEAFGSIAPSAKANIRDVTPGSFLNQNIQAYMNPYTKAVTEQSLQDLERSRQLEQVKTSAQATAAKAFGGSRQGVAEAETNRAYGENAARLVAQQNAAAYTNAQQISEADLGRMMQAQQLNQNKDLATTQQSLQLAGQFGLANQDAALRASLANQGVDVSTGQLNTQNAQQTALANQAAYNQMSQYNAGLGQQAGLANQAAYNQMAQYNAGNQQQAGLASQAAYNQMGQFNAGLTQQANLANQAAFNQAGQFGANAQNTANLTNAQNQLQAYLANQSAGLQGNQQRITAGGQLANAATNLQNLGFGQANQLTQQGNFQQGFSQQQLDAIRNLPLEQQQILNQALGINVGGGSGTQSSSSSGQGLLGLFR